jgi:hypothetical protein
MKPNEIVLQDNGGHECRVSAMSTHDLHDEGSLKMIQDYFKQKKIKKYINWDKYCV